MTLNGRPTLEERERWERWANERATVALNAAKSPKPTAEPHDADWHARAIRRAIEDARRDGMVVDFAWDGYINEMKFNLNAYPVGNVKKAVRIWPAP